MDRKNVRKLGILIPGFIIVSMISGCAQEISINMEGTYAVSITVTEDTCVPANVGTSASGNLTFEQSGDTVTISRGEAYSFLDDPCIDVLNNTPTQGTIDENGSFELNATAELYQRCEDYNFSISITYTGIYTGGGINGVIVVNTILPGDTICSCYFELEGTWLSII